MSITRLKNVLMIVAALTSVTAFRADGGHREGNGGDYIRATFIRMGQAVVQHLKTTPDGMALTAAHELSLDELADTLTIDVVKVSHDPLRDNGNSQVDALGEPGNITLFHAAWFEHFEKARDVYFLVFHEMLRAAGVDDDDYVISGKVRPFPEDGRIQTSIGASIPLVSDDEVESYVDIAAPVVNGAGCPSGFGTLTDFDPTHNALGVRITDFAVADGAGLPLAERRKHCIVSLKTRRLPPGKRLVVTQIDAMGDVSLPPSSSFTITADAYLAGSVSQAGLQSKTVTAGSQPVQGRTLLRASGVMLQTDCGAGPKLLNLSVTGRTQRSSSAASHESRGRVLGVRLYLRLKSC